MSGLDFPTNKGGLRFKYGPWDIGIWMNPDPFGMGHHWVIGHLDDDGWNIVADIVPPMGEADWVELIKAYKGMGNFAFATLPRIRTLLKEHFDLTPNLPQVTNDTPFSVQNFNIMWSQYFKMKEAADDTYPTVVPNWE